MDAIDLLMEARPLIEKGWCQRAFGLKDGLPVGVIKANQWCLTGAIHKVLWENKLFYSLADKAYELLHEVIYGHHGDPIRRLTIWNDDPQRTKEEVLDVIDQAVALGIKKEEETEHS